MDLDDFIRTHVETAAQLRSILLLNTNPEAHWDATAIAARTYLHPKAVAQALARLEARGLVACQGDPPVYIYQPKTAELKRLMDELARLDRERPVTLLQILYERPEDLQAFTDAFKLRKEKED